MSDVVSRHTKGYFEMIGETGLTQKTLGLKTSSSMDTVFLKAQGRIQRLNETIQPRTQIRRQ